MNGRREGYTVASFGLVFFFDTTAQLGMDTSAATTMIGSVFTIQYTLLRQRLRTKPPACTEYSQYGVIDITAIVRRRRRNYCAHPTYI